jgi:hypothetical protein
VPQTISKVGEGLRVRVMVKDKARVKVKNEVKDRVRVGVRDRVKDYLNMDSQRRSN